MSGPVRIFISAGEASGDVYGARLIDALRGRLGEAEFFGCGGDRMRAAGCRTLVDARRIAMVGLVEVLPGLRRAWKALRELRQAIDRGRPQLAILIDFPDINLRLAKRLKRAGVPVLYFVAPQVWAWRKGRLKTLRENVTRLLCIFPFEEAFFQKAGVPAEFVGHPLADGVRASQPAAEFRRGLSFPPDAALIALLPGSRRREILLNLPPMLETARLLSASRKCAFLLPAASTVDFDWLRAQAAAAGLPVAVLENATYDALAHSQAAIVASGTASTEAAILGTPMVIVYRVSALSWLLGRWLVDVPFFSMVNLVLGRQAVPEFIQDKFQPEAVAREISNLLDSPPLRQLMQDHLREFAKRLRKDGREEQLPGRSGPSAAGQIADPIQRSAAIAESMVKGKCPGAPASS
ncbi:MAG TPA: lipid-A-disaccharide synthase [Terriglobia bacterium]|nr:lipid-A-disaccharide synthase [Terriglobia bacterium]